MTFIGKLYPFQKEAVGRMIEPGGTLVAFSMGLGKTILAIAAAEQLIESGQAGGGLVICPASLKYQWERQIKAFTDGAFTQVVDGTPSQRLRQYQRIKNGEVEYAILNYDQVVNDWEYVNKLPRDFIVGDELTAIKNSAPQRSKKMRRLKAEWRWGLTGQPVENRADEIYNIMRWVDPNVFVEHELFEMMFIVRDNYGKVLRYKNLDKMHERLQDVMVRHTRAEVADQMPAVVEESLLVHFDSAGAKLYRRITNDILDCMDGSGWAGGGFDLDSYYKGEAMEFGSEMMGAIASRFVCLRMLCDHPELLRRSADRFDGKDAWAGSASGSAYASELAEVGVLNGLTKTPKLDATIELITEILAESPENKIVLFSFFKDSLQLIQEQVQLKKLTHSVQHTGDMSAKAKDGAKQIFSNDKKCRLFLSSDSGGVGLDLNKANYLINFDLPWSAGAWAQRQARIIRLSTEFPQVTLISILMADSVEERQYSVLQQKQRVADAIVDGRGHDIKGGLSLDLASLSEFLRASTV